MGLFDAFFDSNQQELAAPKPKQFGGLFGLDPTTLGMLAASASLLESGGPSRVPIGTGQALGRALNSGLLGYQTALDHQAEREERQELRDYRRAQIDQLKQKSDSQKDLDAFFKNRLFGYQGVMPAADMDASIQSLGQGAKVGDIGPTLTNAARMDAIRPPAQRGSNSAFPFTLNDIGYLKTKGVDLTDVYKLATDPIKLEGGSLYQDRATGQERYIPKIGDGMTLGANGVSVAPGYINSLSAIKGAETHATEAAKANFDLLPLGYTGQDGRPIGGTRGAYVNSFNQLGMPVPQSNAPQGGVPEREGLDLTRLTPQQQAFLRQQNPEAFANGVARFSSPPVLQSEAERVKQVGDVQARQGTQTDLNKNWITSSYNPILDAGRTASSINSSLDAIKNINLQTGWGTEAKAHAASVLTGLGIAPQNAKFFAANVEKFQSVAMDRLLTTLQAQKGPQTEGDATRAQQTYLQLKNTPEANQFIADFARAKANADMRRAQFYQEALPLAQQSGDLNEIDRRWAKIQGSIWLDPILQRYVRGK